jgi:hypothetical protein
LDVDLEGELSATLREVDLAESGEFRQARSEVGGKGRGEGRHHLERADDIGKVIWKLLQTSLIFIIPVF